MMLVARMVSITTLLMILLLCVVSGVMSLAAVTSEHCKPSSASPPDWFENPFYSLPGVKVSQGFATTLPEARSIAITGLSSEIKVSAQKEVAIITRDIGGVVERESAVEQKSVSNLTLTNVSTEDYLHLNCQYYVLAKIDDKTVDSLLLHQEAELFFENANNRKASRKNRQANLDFAIQLSEKINYALIQLNDGGIFKQKYQRLKKSLSQSQDSHKLVALLYVDKDAEGQQWLDSQNRRHLLENINVWQAKIPDEYVCKELSGCLHIAEQNLALKSYIVAFKSIKFSPAKYGIREGFIEIDLVHYDTQTQQAQQQIKGLVGKVLTRIIPQTQWDIAIERLVKNHQDEIAALSAEK